MTNEQQAYAGDDGNYERHRDNKQNMGAYAGFSRSSSYLHCAFVIRQLTEVSVMGQICIPPRRLLVNALDLRDRAPASGATSKSDCLPSAWSDTSCIPKPR